MAKRREVQRSHSESASEIRPLGQVRCGWCGQRRRRLTEVQVGRESVQACPACVDSLKREAEWSAVAVRTVRLWHGGELGAALREVRSFLRRTRVPVGTNEFRANALAMQAGIQEESGDLGAALRSLRQRDELPFSCQSNYLCHQIQVVGILLRQERYAEAQQRIRQGLKHVYAACLPDALRLLVLFCRIPTRHRAHDLRRYQDLLRRAVQSFGVPEGLLPRGEFDRRVEAVSVLFREGQRRYKQLGDRARGLVAEGDTSAALDLVRAFTRIEPLGFYRQLAEDQWREYGLVAEMGRAED